MAILDSIGMYIGTYIGTCMYRYIPVVYTISTQLVLVRFFRSLTNALAFSPGHHRYSLPKGAERTVQLIKTKERR